MKKQEVKKPAAPAAADTSFEDDDGLDVEEEPVDEYLANKEDKRSYNCNIAVRRMLEIKREEADLQKWLDDFDNW